jgi:beta-carotene hydroxylase
MTIRTKDDAPRKSNSLVDIPTLVVVGAFVAGPAILFYLQSQDLIHPVLSCLLATLLMNMSFTAWHEASHGNFSRVRWLNNVCGVIASFASVYPGYFARRREHLAHHKWEGVEGIDPVYARIQNTNVFLFPFRLLYVDFFKRQKSSVPDSFLPITSSQRISDRISNGLAVLLIAACVAAGHGIEILCVWILPRAIVFWLHAYYICFFPHHIDGGGFEKYRNRNAGRLVSFLTMGQNYHGVHHRWPFIPWHKYFTMAEMKAQHAEKLATAEDAPPVAP